MARPQQRGGVLFVVVVVALLLVAVALLRRQRAVPVAVGNGPMGATTGGRPNGGAGTTSGRPLPGGRVPSAPGEDPAALRAARPPILPDTTLTPGATLDVTTQDICTSGYSQRVRNVPSAVKRQAYDEYGITSHQPGDYEVDHLISLELGGSNSIRNLWPESFRTQPWNAHVKDRLENELHRLVCAGQLDLATAQREIATDWVAAYHKHLGDPPPGGR